MCLCGVYALTGKADSAMINLNRLIKPHTASDSVELWHTKYEIFHAQNKHSEALDAYVHSTMIKDSMQRANRGYLLSIAEKYYDHRSATAKVEELTSRRIVHSSVTIITALLLVIVLIIWRMMIHRRKIEIAQQRLLIEQLRGETQSKHNEILDLIDSRSNLRQTVSHQLSTIRELIDHVYRYEHNPKLFVEKFRQTLKVNRMSDGIWTSMYYGVNKYFANVMTYLQKTYPKLTEEDLNYILLLCCGFSYIDIMMCMGYSNERSSYSRRERIAKKMGITGSLDTFLSNLIETLKKQSENSPSNNA